MRLDELLKIKIDALYKSYNKILKSLDKKKNNAEILDIEIDELFVFVDDLNKNLSSIRFIDSRIVSNILVKYGYYDSYNEIEDKLNSIKVILRGKYDSNLTKLNLTEEQTTFLKEYLENVNKCLERVALKHDSENNDIKSIKSNSELLEDKILSLEVLREKLLDINNNDLLTEEDYELILELSKDESISIEQRKLMLIKFIEYNNDRANHLPKKIDKIDLDEIKQLFESYGINGRISKRIDEYSDEIKEKANINNIRNTLDFLKEKNLLDKFNISDLLVICLFANMESLNYGYSEYISDGIDKYLCLTTPSIWIPNIKKSNRKRTKSQKMSVQGGNRVTLESAAHLISCDEIKENIKFLDEHGFVYDVEDSSAKTIKMPHYKLVEAYKSLRMYGLLKDENIKNFKVYLLSEPALNEKLDKLVEVGLLNGPEDGPEDYTNYIKRFPAKIHNISVPNYIALYYQRAHSGRSEYYATVASKRSGQLAGEVSKYNLGLKLDTEEEQKEFVDNNFVSLPSIIPNYDLYEDIMFSSYESGIDDSVLALDVIKQLEDNYRVSDYIYMFNDQIISRIKVLRTYSILLNNNANHEDALMYSICNSSYLDEQTVDAIRESIGYEGKLVK